MVFYFDVISNLLKSFKRMGELGGLPSMGSHRVRHNCGDLAEAGIAYLVDVYFRRSLSTDVELFLII